MNLPSTPERRPVAVLRALAGILVAFLVTAAAGRVVMAVPMLTSLDLRLVTLADSHLGPIAATVATSIDAGLGPTGVALPAILLVIWCVALRRSWWAGVRGGLLLTVPWGLAELLKLVVRRMRPDPGILAQHLVPDPPSFSFPSGHTAFAAALCCAVLLTLRPGGTRRAVTIVAVLVIAVTAWSRVALGVHHPSDVIASAIMVPIVGALLARALDALVPGDAGDPGDAEVPSATAGPGGTASAVDEDRTMRREMVRHG